VTRVSSLIVLRQTIQVCMSEKLTSQSSVSGMRTRPLVNQIWSVNYDKGVGYYAPGLFVEVIESSVEAMNVALEYSFESLVVKIIDIRASVVRKLSRTIRTISPFQKGCVNL
jgi:hypothetical protein